MIAVDLGCYDPPGGFSSLRSLSERFQPEMLYGFDVQAEDYDSPGLSVRRAAAWIHDGTTTFTRNGTSTSLVGKEEVPCFNFSQWLDNHGPAIVKMDIEGSEYPILHKMMDDRTIALVELLVIEWHGDPIDVGRPTEIWWN